MPLRWVSREDTTERRRASEDYGLRKPKRPKPKRQRTPWQRHRDRHQRVWRATRKHYRKHKHKRGAVAVTGGALGLTVLAVMWAFQGTVSLVTLGVCGGALVGGYAIHKHDEAKVMRKTHRTTTAEKLKHAAAGRQPYRRPEPAEEPAPTGKVRVESHRRDGDGVKTHYRARPGQGAGDEQRRTA